MKKILLFCIVIFRFLEAAGQDKSEKILYLKNGSVVKGKIIAELPDKYIRIKLTDKSIAKYQRDEVDSIGSTGTLPVKNRMAYKAPDSTVNFYLIAETGPGIGIGQNGSSKFIFNLREYFQINRYYGVGMGLGYRYYFREQTASFPIFVHYRIQLPQNKLKPFYSFGIGVAATPRNDYFATTIEEPIIMHNIGINYPVSKKIKVHFGFGLDIQVMTQFLDGNPWYNPLYTMRGGKWYRYQRINGFYYDYEELESISNYSFSLIGGITF